MAAYRQSVGFSVQCFVVTQEGYLRVAEALGPTPLELKIYRLPGGFVSHLTRLDFGPLATAVVETNRLAPEAIELITSVDEL